MKPKCSEVRATIINALGLNQYEIVGMTSETYDPFTWSIRAKKGDYEIVVEEKHAPYNETLTC